MPLRLSNPFVIKSMHSRRYCNFGFCRVGALHEDSVIINVWMEVCLRSADECVPVHPLFNYAVRTLTNELSTNNTSGRAPGQVIYTF